MAHPGLRAALPVGGLVIGLGTRLVAALVADLLDRTVKTERNLEDLVSCPVLVSISRASPLARRATT